jgi:hypothetical protein
VYADRSAEEIVKDAARVADRAREHLHGDLVPDERINAWIWRAADRHATQMDRIGGALRLERVYGQESLPRRPAEVSPYLADGCSQVDGNEASVRGGRILIAQCVFAEEIGVRDFSQTNGDRRSGIGTNGHARIRAGVSIGVDEPGDREQLCRFAIRPAALEQLLGEPDRSTEIPGYKLRLLRRTSFVLATHPVLIGVPELQSTNGVNVITRVLRN